MKKLRALIKSKKALTLAKRIKKAETWYDCTDDAYKLCKIAGLENDYRKAKSEWVQAYVAVKAARILNVDITGGEE